MAQFLTIRTMQFFGQIYPENTSITCDKDRTVIEAEKGVHPKTKRPISALFNHCEQADTEAKEISEQFFGNQPDKKTTISQFRPSESIEQLRKELSELKIPLDSRWGIAKLKEELLKGKKKRGL